MSSRDDIFAAIQKQMGKKVAPEPEESSSAKKKPTPKGPPRPPGPYTTGEIKDIFTDGQIRDLAVFLKTDPRKTEIEASFGSFRGDSPSPFHPGVRSLFRFNVLKEKLDAMSVYTSQYYDRVDIIQVPVDNERIYTRRITDLIEHDEEPIYQEKKRFRSINNSLWGIRVSESGERFEENSNFDEVWDRVVGPLLEKEGSERKPKSKDVAIQRFRRRVTYTEPKPNAVLYGVEVALTRVSELHIKSDGTKYTLSKQEVEVERVRAIDVDRFTNAVTHILKLLTPVGRTMDMKELKLAVTLHNNIFWRDIRSSRRRFNNPYQLFGGYWNKPRNIKLNNMLTSHFDPYVTIKLDGRRNSMLISSNGVYIYSPPYTVFKIAELSEKDADLDETLIDCEYMDDGEIFGFDILFYRGEDVRHKKFDERLDLLKSVAQSGLFHPKKYFMESQIHLEKYLTEGRNVKKVTGGVFYDRVQKAFSEIDKKPYKGRTDGLIFQPRHWYKNNHTFKWKDAKYMTIDFLLVALSPEDLEAEGYEDIQGDDQPYRLLVGEGGTNIVFRGTHRYPFDGVAILDSLDGMSLDGKIVECKWDDENKTFISYRIRDDRDKPNNSSTAKDVWMDIMNPISEATIKGHTLQLMRKYHNSKKLALLDKVFSQDAVLLDIGSGRGGDLHKWDKIRAKKVYAIEPNDKNLEELERRRADSKIRTEVVPLNFGAEQTDKIKDSIHDKLDGIISFFSLTFFPQSQEMYDGLLDTLSLLPPGGRFVGIVMDGYLVRDLLNDIRSEENIPDDEAADYNSKAFSIEQTSEFDDKVVGNAIEISIHDPTSMVKEQEEWLFYFEPFRRALNKRGFKLLSTDILDKGDAYDVLPKSSKIFSSLNRAFIFEKKRVKTVKVRIESLSPEKVAPLPKYDDMFYIGIHQGPLNFIHALLRGASSDYSKMNNEERQKYALKVRRKLGEKMSLQDFKEFEGGRIAEQLIRPYLKEFSEKDALEIAYLEYKLKIMLGEEWMGESPLLVLASKMFDIDIYILEGTNLIPSKRFAYEGDRDFYSNSESIILLSPDGFRYSLVGRDDGYIFDSSSDIIQEIRNQIY